MRLIFQLFLILNCGVLLAQKSTLVAPKTYVAQQTSKGIKIDGKAKERAWKKAKWTSDFIDIEGVENPSYQTRVKMIWDQEFLYFYAEMEEPHVWANLKQRDTVIFYNNDFEIFIDPDGDTFNYMEFEMNALNTIWDLYLTKPYREGGKVLDNWDIKGIKTAVAINGTLNDATDVDKGWSVEIAMPWEALKEAGNNQIPENDFWRINFSRVNWDFELNDNKYQRKKDASGAFLPEYNWVWSPQWVINMHEPEWWAYVFFASEENQEFEIPSDEKIKWEMYRVYRQQKKHFNENGRWMEATSASIPKSIYVDGVEVKLKLENHSEGWNLKVESPFTEKLLMIKEDGEFTSKNKQN
ncbi:carbohydrate-binding family 9-like protein [Joostella sp. CR20]|uniref:carbohydrate-binding family 9-like protein n=1 Tax=Joostella sp. CR20 TaxID=2804312 RepID=UPI00313DE757